MKTTVVCGLLGSGKTTFIKSRAGSMREKTVVLVNDFGAAGVDGEIFSAAGIESVELPGGCVCCTLKFDLITTINRVVKEFAPGHLMIEPSGIASPSGVIEALGSAGIDDVTVIGIVDATEFSELYEAGMYGGFFKDQIVNSDLILVNKTDLAEVEEIVEAMRLIESINPLAIVLPSVNADPEQPLPAVERNGVRMRRRRSVTASETHFHFETMSFRLSRETKLSQLSLFFDDLAKGRYGAAARAKALIKAGQRSYRWDLVFGKVDCIPFDRDVDDSRIVVIGQSLDGEGLEQAVKRLSS